MYCHLLGSIQIRALTKYVYNAKAKNVHPLPLSFVDLFWNDNNKHIYNITSLPNTKVVVKKPHRKKYGPLQCHNYCQSYGHTHNYCNHSSRCIKCSDNHHTEDYTKDCNSTAKCVLCYFIWTILITIIQMSSL